MIFDAPRPWDNLPLRLSNEEISRPYEVIHDFFSAFEKHRTITILQRWLYSVCSNKKCKESPSTLLFFYEKIEYLIEAAYLISQLNNSERKAVLQNDSENEDFNIMSAEYFCAWGSSKFTQNPAKLIWQDFPRSLNTKEFFNPYSVFKKTFRFYSLGEWRQELSNLFNIALSKESLLDDGLDTDILSVEKHLLKLIDASHLIDIREFRLDYVTSINGKASEDNG